MPRVPSIALEFLRPGPSDNQLLSRLTPYVVLCGQHVSTLYLEFEHREVLRQLRALDYDGPEELRQAQLVQTREAMGRLLGQIPALAPELTLAARCVLKETRFIHLRVVSSAAELALLPLELSLIPPGCAGAGQSLLLNMDPPVCLTREVRQPPARVTPWFEEPRILCVIASPPPFAPVPADYHVQALRRALAPWVIGGAAEEVRDSLDERITVLQGASLEAIRRACEERHYTHVHVLAHGGAYRDTGEQQFGVILHDPDHSDRSVTVDAERLAQALRHRDASGRWLHPCVVTLATCHGGRAGSVVMPGGSVAHRLHLSGIPLVVASQFPLTMYGSVVFVDTFYRDLLLGEDPRLALHRTRMLLQESPNRHDWASLVAYASFPPEFEAELYETRYRWSKQAIDRVIQLAKRHTERLIAGAPRADGGGDAPARGEREATVRHLLLELDEHTARLEGTIPQAVDLIHDSHLGRLGEYAREAAGRAIRSESLGLLASAAKQRAELLFRLRKDAGDAEVRQFLVRARDRYREAVEADPGNHWVRCQYVALEAVLEGQLLEEDWQRARMEAEWKLKAAGNDKERAWAHGTLAELELLRLLAPDEAIAAKAKGEALGHAHAVTLLVQPTDFARLSTRRQFERYVTWWMPDRAEVSALAQKIVEFLSA
jgi:hypothetical protein